MDQPAIAVQAAYRIRCQEALRQGALYPLDTILLSETPFKYP